MQINYKERKLVSPEETSTQDVQFAVEDARLKLQSDILATRRSLNEAKTDLENSKMEYPLNAQCIVDLTSKVEGYEKGLEIMLNLAKELGLE